MGDHELSCRDGTWSGDPPECRSFCPAIRPSVAFSTECSFNNVEVNCEELVKVGTIATINCRYGYELINAEQQKTTCQMDGQWHPHPSSCAQICGERGQEDAETDIEKAPWHVTIYKRQNVDSPFNVICGGTIINLAMIVSAVRCFWNETKGDKDDYNLFQMKTGSSQSEYENTSDNEDQYFAPLVISYGYKAIENNFDDDVALVLLGGYIEFNPYTFPICINYDQTAEEDYISPSLKGLMGHWGVKKIADAAAEPNTSLRTIEYSVISRERCKNDTTTEFQSFLTSDKFCAERLSEGLAVCSSNSGSGLVFPFESNGTRRTKYFLRGVASVAAPNGTCGGHPYTIFTSIAYVRISLMRYDALVKPRLDTFINTDSKNTGTVPLDCDLDFVPENGFVSSLNNFDNKLDSNSTLYNFNTLLYGCNGNYTLKGDPTSDCINGVWTNPDSKPECIPFSTGVNTGMAN